MGFYKPPTLNDGCIFREDFRSPELAASNGLRLEGSGVVIDNGLKVTTSNTGRAKCSHPGVTGSAATVIFDVTMTNITTITDIAASYQSASALGGITFYVINSEVNALNPVTYTNRKTTALLGRHTYAYSFTDSGSIWVIDGVPSASGSMPTANVSSARLTLFSQEISGFRSVAGQVMHQFRIYNRALSAEEIRADYYRTRGL